MKLFTLLIVPALYEASIEARYDVVGEVPNGVPIRADFTYTGQVTFWLVSWKAAYYCFYKVTGNDTGIFGTLNGTDCTERMIWGSDRHLDSRCLSLRFSDRLTAFAFQAVDGVVVYTKHPSASSRIPIRTR
ncbi:hypothetical protein FOL47_004773 [Perkinsus chesapeaki]|uniref:Uncharacterized protein n=1 Tax=Perkinsus chesapeaki TaxID=330153 RepID=A0A7J6MYY3_PERCH|nr:hypothetical protein FOL47_004773 [Perkinsus chesapeaki]